MGQNPQTQHQVISLYMMKASMQKSNNRIQDINYKTANKDHFCSKADQNRVNNKFQILYNQDNNQEAFFNPPVMSNRYLNYKQQQQAQKYSTINFKGAKQSKYTNDIQIRDQKQSTIDIFGLQEKFNNVFKSISNEIVMQNFPSKIKFSPGNESYDVEKGKHQYEQRIQTEKNYLKKYDIQGNHSPQNKNNLQRFYYYMNECVKLHGPELKNQFGKIVEYEIDLGNQKETVVIDLKNQYNHKTVNGIVYLKGMQKHYRGPAAPIPDSPDLVLKMDRKTFDDLGEKKLGGAWAFLTGRVKLNGSLTTLKQFEDKVLCKYFNDLYDKDMQN